MPFYDYKCDSCNHVFELYHAMKDVPKEVCPKCGSKKYTKLLSKGIRGMSGNKEVWDYNDIHQVKPKYLKSKDGKTRVRYDGNKHGKGAKGSG